MTFCKIFQANSIYPDTNIEELTLSASDQEPSVVIFSLDKDDKEMVEVLTKRLVMYIGVQGSVESLLGAIFEIYMRNGFIGEEMENTNIRNIFGDPVISLLRDYYGHDREVMGVIQQYCYFKD